MRLFSYLELTTASFLRAETPIASVPICLFSGKKRRRNSAIFHSSTTVRSWLEISLRNCWNDYTGEHIKNDHTGSNFVGKFTENGRFRMQYCSEYQRYFVCLKTMVQTFSHNRRQIWWFISWFSMLCTRADVQHVSKMVLLSFSFGEST